MKKSYFLMAAAAAMFAACSETELVNAVNETEAQKTISFENFVGKATRAEYTEKEDVRTGGFRVWGYYGASDAFTTPETAVYGDAGTAVTWSGTEWQTADLRYWNSAKFYKFYAVAPSTGTYTMTDNENGYVKIENVASAKASESVDYLVTRGSTVYKGSTKPVVPLDFHHTMAKVTVAVKRTTASNITVKAITMTGWDNATGVFTQASAVKPTTLNTTEWTLGTKVDGTAKFLETTDAAISLTTNDAVEAATKWIFVPQQLAAGALTFELTYAIDGTEYTKTGAIADAHVWGTDSHTTYTISIGEPLIQFSVNSVCSWCVDATGDTTITH